MLYSTIVQRDETGFNNIYEAAQALEDAYGGKMSDRPQNILHSCYRTASDEFGV